MPVVREVLARVEVENLDTALETYCSLAGTTDVRRFRFGDIELAWVGPFLLLAGAPPDLERVRRTATLLVTDIGAAQGTITGTGGEILEGPAHAPNGARMIARHADGAVFEYIEVQAG
ncbi:hypothetical protein GKO32_10930 [Amycolatopsis sp. RM579]|uniref:VOC family protein n=2 Tax=Amycolatopsis pithecellobii TaxID=664692 RepID=A0A6N7Z540_9PSEU|nr:hypothetical protein [Amycolatopsis pithecellobii]